MSHKQDIIKRVSAGMEAGRLLTELKPDLLINNPSSYKVYKDFSCKLVKTDKQEKQRYYIIQILQKNQSYYVFSHWGTQGILKNFNF